MVVVNDVVTLVVRVTVHVLEVSFVVDTVTDCVKVKVLLIVDMSVIVSLV